MLTRIRDKCVSRGERGLFGLKRLFQTFDSNGNGTLEFKEFKRAIKDFKLEVEDVDIENIFKSFDKNGDGVLQMEEFMDMILGQLNSKRMQAVDEAWAKLDASNRGYVMYSKVRDTFDGKKHPDVGNGKKTEEAAITDFLEMFEVHHNTFNNYERQDKVTKEEFVEFYRTLGPSYEEDGIFACMVRGVWGVKNEAPDVSQRGWAGGKDGANSRQRYMKANYQTAPFGTSQDESAQNWGSSTKTAFKAAPTDYS